MEVFTGMAVYLRTIATGQRYSGSGNGREEELGGGSSSSSKSSGDAPADVQLQLQQDQKGLFAEGYGLDVWGRLFALVQELRQDMEKFIADNAAHQVEPEFECWEALLITLRCTLDYCVVCMQEKGKGEREVAERLFREAAALRKELVEESRTRFEGRMRILWLQEA
ncbi:excreted/secreted protein 15 [Trypanosoma grayi]|uniref:excreted/secreted protein 15 n=1 Tax=Trypanosoma grayi TaxID=71804 RepID=UPI0004F46672|nr:excreted/secreted protein 15 [Trypanosoma grayi]KEG06668.1 excreted/secreted protein 15 [Trypanosoma grayi]